MIYNDETASDASKDIVMRINKVALAVLAGAAYGRRIRLALNDARSDRRDRYREALALVNSEAKSKLTETTQGLTSAEIGFLKSIDFSKNNSEVLRGRFTEDEQIALLLTAHTSNPVAPYSVQITDQEREKALAAFAGDIGAPASFSDLVISCSKKALKCHAQGVSLAQIVLIAAGLAVIAAAPALVALVAPAGLAGGAAIMAGLAALGPGGMIGGLAVVSAVGATGATLTSRALTLTSGTREAVQSTVIFLQTLSLIRHNRRPWEQGIPEEVKLLQAMRTQLAEELSEHERLDDKGSKTLKDLKTKIGDVDKALSCLQKDGLGSAPAIEKGNGNSK